MSNLLFCWWFPAIPSMMLLKQLMKLDPLSEGWWEEPVGSCICLSFVLDWFTLYALFFILTLNNIWNRYDIFCKAAYSHLKANSESVIKPLSCKMTTPCYIQLQHLYVTLLFSWTALLFQGLMLLNLLLLQSVNMEVPVQGTAQC